MKTEKNYETKRKTRNSVIMFGIVFLFAVSVLIFLRMKPQGNATTAVVTVNGEEFYKGSLFLEKEISVNETNTLIIKDGVVDMVFADCPDQICVKHPPISQVGESIICLPNKVVVTVETLTTQKQTSNREVDAIVK